MKIQFATTCLAIVLLSRAAWGQPPTPPNQAQPTPPQQTADLPLPPELILDAVPELLRLHVPILGNRNGVWVRSVTPGSSADRAGLRNGDILLEAGGRPVIEGQPLSEADAALPSVVLRRGRPLVLNPSATEMRMIQPRLGGGFLADPAMQPSGARSVSSASSFSGPGGRAVSISRSGEQISLELSIPTLADAPIRLRGTYDEIERELQAGKWSAAIKHQVRRALRQAK